MGKFTVIPQDTFEALQLEAGVLLSAFDPTNPVAPNDEDIICATSGGIKVTATPTFSDMGEDVDNCPVNMMELKHLDSWECTVSFTAIDTSPETIQLGLGVADVAGNKITPRRSLSQSDFTTIWWVGDRADGGMVAIKLFNALSTAGLSLTTTKAGKGNFAVTLTGHVSINAQDTVPMEFYSMDGEDAAVPAVNLSAHAATIGKGTTKTLVALTTPDGKTVTWSSSNTTYATVDTDGVVTAKNVAGSTIITASITVDGVAYTDTCTIIVV